MRLRSLLSSLAFTSPANSRPSIANSSHTVPAAENFDQLSVDQQSQLRSILNCGQPVASAGHSQMSVNHSPAVPAPLQSTTSYAQPVSQQVGAMQITPAQQYSASSITASTPISPYQSIRMMGLPSAPDGHPSVAASAAAGSSSQLFLGFNNLGVNMRGQVNQRRLASSTATVLRGSQPHLPARGRRRGPAVHPPSLLRSSGPRIEDCLLNVPENNGLEVVGPLLHLKVKVYPPPV